MGGPSQSDTRPGLGWTAPLVLGVAAVHWPLTIMATHPYGIGHPERLILIMLAQWGAGLGFWWLLVKTGVRPSTALPTVFTGLLMWTYGGRLLHEIGRATGWIVIIAVVALASYVFRRLGDHILVAALMVAVTVGFLSRPAVSLLRTWSLWEADQVIDSPPLELTLSDRPDVFVVVVDGYPGPQSLELDDGVLGRRLVDELNEHGYQVLESAWAAYWGTDYSIPSLLEMSYPVVDQGGGGATTRSLYEIVGGDNTLIEVAQQNGYRTTMIESGWNGSSCGDVFDNCVPAPFFDEATFFVLEDSVAGPYIFDSVGYSFTTGTLRTMNWILDKAPQISRTDDPQLVFAHVLAPHPPFFLDSSCVPVPSADRSGVQFYIPGVRASDREGYFRDQVECVDGFLIRLARSVEPDDVVVYVADHGTDRREQLSMTRSEWSVEELVERMNVFAAVHTGRDCVIPDPVMVPNLMRAVFTCISSQPLPDLPERMWIPPMVEVDQAQLTGLLGR